MGGSRALGDPGRPIVLRIAWGWGGAWGAGRARLSWGRNGKVRTTKKACKARPGRWSRVGALTTARRLHSTPILHQTAAHLGTVRSYRVGAGVIPDVVIAVRFSARNRVNTPGLMHPSMYTDSTLMTTLTMTIPA